MQSTLVNLQGKGTNPKNVLYVGGLEESINEAILHSAFIAFGEIKDVNIPLDNTTGAPAERLSAQCACRRGERTLRAGDVQVSTEGLASWSMRTRQMPPTQSTTCTTQSCTGACCGSTTPSP